MSYARHGVFAKRLYYRRHRVVSLRAIRLTLRDGSVDDKV